MSRATRTLARAALGAGLAMALVLGASPLAPVSIARAADVLVVCDLSRDAAIATALRADGHVVTLVLDDYATGNAALRADLSAYDAIVWSAGGGTHDPAVIDALTARVRAGGRVLVTGADVPTNVSSDPSLLFFLGAVAATDFTGPPARVVALENNLTTGLFDIRGQRVYSPFQRRDGLLGLGDDTQAVLGSISGDGLGSPGAQWALRRLGDGEIAFMASGDEFAIETSAWIEVSTGPEGAYNAALRNFIASSEEPLPPPAPGTSVADGGSSIVDAGTSTPLAPCPPSARGCSVGRGSAGAHELLVGLGALLVLAARARRRGERARA